jgi:hypothetical protein
MSANAEPIFWPEPYDEIEDELPRVRRMKIIHSRHCLGDCEITHVILDSRDESEPAVR